MMRIKVEYFNMERAANTEVQKILLKWNKEAKNINGSEKRLKKFAQDN